MKVSHGRTEGGTSQHAQGTFSGEVWQDPVLSEQGIRINDVLFQPGARTFWHAHPGGQVLVVRTGEGHVQTRAGERVTVHAGDVVYAAPGEVHWHGATGHSYLVHTAISLGTTEWHEEVSQADYQGG